MEKIEYIIFDFDYTISAFHLHYECMQLLSKHPEYQHGPYLMDHFQQWDDQVIQLLWEELKQQKKLVATGDPALWQKIFMTLINDHFTVFIASFSSFQPIIKRFLKEIIGIPEKYLNMIQIEAWLPYDQHNKNLHIDRILKGLSISKNIDWESQSLSDEERKTLYKKIILIDDSLDNIESVIHLVGARHGIIVPHKPALIPQVIIDTLSERLAIWFE